MIRLLSVVLSIVFSFGCASLSTYNKPVTQNTQKSYTIRTDFTNRPSDDWKNFHLNVVTARDVNDLNLVYIMINEQREVTKLAIKVDNHNFIAKKFYKNVFVITTDKLLIIERSKFVRVIITTK